MQTYHGSPGEPSWICMPPDTDITRTARESAQRLRSAPQARSEGLAHIFPQFCRWMRRRSSPADGWPPSQSRGAASIHLGHHRGPSTSSLRDLVRRALGPSTENGLQPLHASACRAGTRWILLHTCKGVPGEAAALLHPLEPNRTSRAR